MLGFSKSDSNNNNNNMRKGVFNLANIKPEDIKETYEVPPPNPEKYESWMVVIDS